MSAAAEQAPQVESLTVLYDASCSLCGRVRRWLDEQHQLVPLHWVACRSPEARAMLPHLDHERTGDEITVVADTGEVWTSEGAWIVCLWATAEHRTLARWLSHPRRRAQARSVALAVAANRPRRRPSGGWHPPVEHATCPDGSCGAGAAQVAAGRP